MWVMPSSTRGFAMNSFRLPIPRRFRSAGLIIGGLIVCICIGFALLGPTLWKTDPLHMEPMHILEPPGIEVPFGGDEFGRDVFARTVAGMRLSLSIAGGGVLMGAFIGIFVGLLGGYYRGRANA